MYRDGPRAEPPQPCPGEMIAHSNRVAARLHGEAPCPRAAHRGGADNVYAGEVEIVPGGVSYKFASATLEGLTPPQKHLIRMGPDNMRLVQDQLRAIARELGIPDTRLPPRQ